MKMTNNDSTKYYMSYLVSLYMNDGVTNKTEEPDEDCNLNVNNHESKD